MSLLLPPIESWSDWSSVFKDVRVWRPAIEAICRREGISYRRIETPPSNTNAVFVLDRRLVLKIYSPFWSEFEIERRLIEVLGANEAVPVPSIVASGRLQDRATWSYLVVEHCAGLTLQGIRLDINRNDLLGIASQVGLVTRALHQTDVRLFEEVDTGESWEDLVDRRRGEALSELTDKKIITSGVAKELAGILDEVVEGSKHLPRVVVHRDLESDHVLLRDTEDGWRVASLIDFGDAKVGVRDYEWMALWFGLFDRDVEAMRAFVEAYDPSLLTDEEFPRRATAWTVLHDFGTDTVGGLFDKTGASTPVESLDAFQELLWPGLAKLYATYC